MAMAMRRRTARGKKMNPGSGMACVMERSRCALLAVVLGAFLVGCAGPQVAKDATPESIKGRGVVVVSVTHDAETGRKSRAAFVFDKNSKTFETRLLRSVEDVLGIPKGSDFEDHPGRVYVLDLEPGVHSVDGWSSRGDMAQLAPRHALAPLTFEVRAGEVIYIGNLNLNHTLGRNLFGLPVVAHASAEVRDRREMDLALAERKVTSLKGRVQARLLPLGTWGAPAADTDRKIQMPPGLMVPPVKP
jgi:hypothetical protein